MTRRVYTLTFVAEAEHADDLPDTSRQLADGIAEGLPEEWWDAEVEGYAIVDIIAGPVSDAYKTAPAS